MDWSQWIYIALLALAFAAAWWRDVFSRAIFLLMLVNLLATIEAPSIIWVGIADLFCAAMLIGRGKTANFIACIFALMVPLYVLDIYLGWSEATTFAIVDLLAYLQLGLIANGTDGNHRKRRAFDFGWRHALHSSQAGGHPKVGNSLANLKDRQE